MKESRHGIVVPLSSIHSKKSAGMGEFLDLIVLIDWCREVGMSVIQLLPINDSGTDPSPYNPLSSCALNPLYISLRALPQIPDPLQKGLENLQKLCEFPKVPYQRLIKEKLDWLFQYYENKKKEILFSPEFKTFLSQNQWLEPYSHYKNLEQPEFHKFLQFLCFQQMSQVKAYASEHSVSLMGDIPIFVSGSSVDVLTNKSLFNTELSAGAPPDAYNSEGQSWGFPIYNWDALKAEDFSWWKNRLRYAAHFYDLFRIDHIVGIFRIWTVPKGKSAKEGHFVPEDESQWYEPGQERLMMMIKASSMVPIGEDLGVVPKRVREVMAELGICGTKVMRWERNWETDRSFISFEKYPPLSLTTLSTHDSETLEMWWRDKPEEAKAYADFKHWSYDPKLSLEKRIEILKDSHHTPSLYHINLLQEYLPLFSELTWPNPEDERINVTERPDPNNWLYRYRPSLEELLHHDKLKEMIKLILK